jgi:dihydroorotase
MRLVESGRIALPTLIERLTTAPVRALDLDRSVPGIGTLAPGASADIVLLDPDAQWVVDPGLFASKGKNTPLAGVTLAGKVVATLAAGRIAHETEVALA